MVQRTIFTLLFSSSVHFCSWMVQRAMKMDLVKSISMFLLLPLFTVSVFGLCISFLV